MRSGEGLPDAGNQENEVDREKMKSNFSRVLSLLRQEKGVSQRKAAAELGISQALLSHYENGIREPGLNFVSKACDYYPRIGGLPAGAHPQPGRGHH